ncbi:acyl-CoA dehydrogenase family protein [Lentzea albidocapillata]|uniref:Acyl-CoA dehydrogenase, C-terminal domain n=1 Tax=Lentzea albidocapillata TaxID=40571 RepID=A0A1W2C2T9_9PSEU|nr:acyl-CoA dehydrogenase family protein [Lentzea albidocapillata]SMC79499.1 Acyl-CoA dehydrogenase, C-terminal domain [Lentzea albidocapillata]
MDFQLDETQQEIATLAADVLGRESATPWKALGEAGLLALAVPERLGGDGLGVLETAVLLTEVGRRAVDVPALATLALGVLPIVRYGTPEQQDALLPLVTEQHGVLTAALSEPSRPLPAEPATTAGPDGIFGVKINVPYVAEASRILVSTNNGVFVVDPAQPGVSTSDGTVRLEGARGELLEGAAEGIRRFALAGACAVADGVLAGALDLTVQHVGTRHQFGKPLATFQAAALLVADVYIASRTLHLAALTAAWSLDDNDLDTAAYWLAAETLPAVHTCHHLHGGLGLDITYPMHRYYGMAKELTRFVGGVEHRLGAIDVH